MYALILVFITHGGFDVASMHTQTVPGFASESLCEKAATKVAATHMTIVGWCVRLK